MTEKEMLQITKAVQLEKLDGAKITLIEYKDMIDVYIQYHGYILSDINTTNQSTYQIVDTNEHIAVFPHDLHHSYYTHKGLKNIMEDPKDPADPYIYEPYPQINWIKDNTMEKFLSNGAELIHTYTLTKNKDGDPVITRIANGHDVMDNYMLPVKATDKDLNNLNTLFILKLAEIKEAINKHSNGQDPKELGIILDIDLEELFTYSEAFTVFMDSIPDYKLDFKKAFFDLLDTFSKELERKTRSGEPLKPRSLTIEKTQQLKSLQYKEATNPENTPDANGLVTVPINQDIYQSKKSHIKTKGTLTVSRITDTDIQNTDVLLFNLQSKVIKDVQGAILTKDDGRVFMGICTVLNTFKEQDPEAFKDFLDGKTELPVTYQQIYQGMGIKKRISKTSKKAINQSMTKLMGTFIYYDWNEEQRARRIDVKDAVSEYGIERVMVTSKRAKDIFGQEYDYQPSAQRMVDALPAKLKPVNAKKDPDTGEVKELQGYFIKSIPPLFVHALLTGKIATIPIELYDIPEFTRMTPRRNALISGLAERIDTMKYHAENNPESHSKGNYNLIELENFFNEYGIEYTTRQDRKNIIDDIEIILKHFINLEFIKSYSLKDKGRKTGLVKIQLLEVAQKTD